MQPCKCISEGHRRTATLHKPLNYTSWLGTQDAREACSRGSGTPWPGCLGEARTRAWRARRRPSPPQVAHNDHIPSTNLGADVDKASASSGGSSRGVWTSWETRVCVGVRSQVAPSDPVGAAKQAMDKERGQTYSSATGARDSLTGRY